MVQVPVLAIHGGAGTINREALSTEAEREYRGALQSILEKGRDALTAGASALDAVTLAVSMLEDCPLFNAGRGAVYTSAETHEMDAAIMDGSTLRTGALSCVHGVKNPIRAARVVMEQSPHVLMTSDGAMAFLREHGVEFMPDAYFDTVWLSCIRRRRGSPARQCSTTTARLRRVNFPSPETHSTRRRKWALWGRWRWIAGAIWLRRPPRAA